MEVWTPQGVPGGPVHKGSGWDESWGSWLIQQVRVEPQLCADNLLGAGDGQSLRQEANVG